jgi:endo-1,4-beta-D-glucanase Y
MSKKIIVLVIATVVSTLSAAPAKFPFPQKAQYNGNIITDADAIDTIQNYYQYWLSKYYEESGDGSLARVRWDELDKTVSEGIGYGMLIMVYMDNDKNNTRAKFDKLWAYYKKFPDGCGLMHWKIQGFNNVMGYNAASDAEIDVLMALIMAYKQWGDEKYKNDAQWLAGKMLDCEVNGGNQLVGGDQLKDKLNPSYFSIATMKMCQNPDVITDSGKRDRWKQVVQTSYAAIKSSRDQNTGYIPDWCSLDGRAIAPLMGYDAIRAPWRIAWGYAWFGDAEAKEICDKIAATAVKEGIAKYDQNRTFTGAFMLSAMTDTSKMAWMKEKYKVLVNLSLGADVYYGQSLNVMYLLLVTGNMPNLYTQTPTVPFRAQPLQSILPTMEIISGHQLTISFTIPTAATVNLSILDSKGRVVAPMIANRACEKGVYTIGSPIKLAHGIYFASLRSGSNCITKKIVVAW